jgi:hypothetical protein
MHRRIPTALIAALCLCGPRAAWASPPATPQVGVGVDPEQGAPPTTSGPASSPASPATPATPEGGAPAQPGDESADDPGEGEGDSNADATDGPEPQTPQAGGIAGVVSADDPDATKATRELEGDSLGDALPAGVPERMTRLQRAAWWTMFGAIGLGATGGVFAGLVERQEDRAVRLQRTYDLDAGARPIYEDVRSEYESIVDRGEAYEATSMSLLGVGAAAFVASVVLFSVNASRTAKTEKSMARGADGDGVRWRLSRPARRASKSVEIVSPRAGLVEVRF